MLVSTTGWAMAATSVFWIPVFEAVRIRRVKIILPGTLGAANNPSIDLEWSSFLGRNIKLTKVVTSSTGTSFTSVPPAGSRAAMWSSSNTSGAATSTLEEIVFVISHTAEFGALAATVNFFLDVEFEGVVSNDTASLLTATIGGTTPQAAGMYALPLDNLTTGNAVGAAQLSPTGYPDIRIGTGNAGIGLVALTRAN